MSPDTTATSGAAVPGAARKLPATLLLALLIGILGYAFRDSLHWMWVKDWPRDEYNHCYLIPFIAAFLIATRSRELAAVPWPGSLAGLWLVLLGFLLLLLGSLSSIFTIAQYGFITAVWGCFVAVWGWPAVKLVWPALAYLVFMVPLPSFLEVKLTAGLQLLSTQIAVAVIRLAGVPVFVEGNIIDLGSYQLAVAEACSGLRYLFPLVSFSFFCAYIFRGRLWQKAVIFLSAIPITIFMNSFRIAVTGVLVNRYGTGQAEGFLHYFEGWIIFVACIALLFLEMGIFALLNRRRLAEVFEVEIPGLDDFRLLLGEHGVRRPLYVALGLLLVGMAGSLAIQVREEVVPQGRNALSGFPLVLGDWRGQDGTLTADVLGELKLTDYLIAKYSRADDRIPVELYVAYYDSQRKGASVHSPKACLPGGGWQMDEFGQHTVADAGPDGAPLQVNRALISKGDTRALVYYWFMQRGRYLTSEYLVKWFIFWDSLWHNRSDGAMVRVTVPLTGGEDIATADRRVAEFIRTAEPKLYYFIPQESLDVRPLRVR